MSSTAFQKFLNTFKYGKRADVVPQIPRGKAAEETTKCTINRDCVNITGYSGRKRI